MTSCVVCLPPYRWPPRFVSIFAAYRSDVLAPELLLLLLCATVIVCRSDQLCTCCRTCLRVARHAWLVYSFGDTLVHSVAPGGRLVVISFHPVSVDRCQKEGRSVYQANCSISMALLSTCGARRRERIGSSSTLSRISLPQQRTQRGSRNGGGGGSNIASGSKRPKNP